MRNKKQAIHITVYTQNFIENNIFCSYLHIHRFTSVALCGFPYKIKSNIAKNFLESNFYAKIQ